MVLFSRSCGLYCTLSRTAAANDVMFPFPLLVHKQVQSARSLKRPSRSPLFKFRDHADCSIPEVLFSRSCRLYCSLSRTAAANDVPSTLTRGTSEILFSLLQGENRLRNSAHLNPSGSAWSRPDLAAHPGLNSFPASRAQTRAICVVLEASTLPTVLFSSSVMLFR